MWNAEIKIPEVTGLFIKYCERGTLKADNRVQYYRIIYDENDYSDSLYEKYEIPFLPHLHRGVRKRRAEYLAGRICSARILHHARVLGVVVTEPNSRAPVWPPSVTGSISHCRDQAICVIYPRDQGHIGVDLEFMDAEVLAESADVIVPPPSSKKINKLPLEIILLNFSAKESLFKALYPQVRQYFGFEYADLDKVSPNIASELSVEEGQFVVALNRDLGSIFLRTHSWVGHYAYDAGTKFICTLVIDPA